MDITTIFCLDSGVPLKILCRQGTFPQAILDSIAQAPTKDKAKLASLLSLQFQTSKAVSIVGGQPPVVPFPVVRRKRTATRKVSTRGCDALMPR